ncbi:MAG: hypothetical protein LBG98_01400 [Puniceicoccales bacterium]|nr:hypothetical protein [Puniceicoccales bacterium]
MEDNSISLAGNARVEAFSPILPAAGHSSLTTRWSVAKGSLGSGKVTTLRQLKQSESPELLIAPKTSLRQREVRTLKVQELPQILKDVFSRSD